MPFRGAEDDDATVGVQGDPWARFVALDAALDADRGLWGDRVPRRFAAVALLGAPLPPSEVAAAVARIDAEMKAAQAWFAKIDASSRLLLSALLLKHGDTVDAFLTEAVRARALFRDRGLPRDRMYEFIAIAVLRGLLRKAPIEDGHVVAMHALYREMKRHHWVLTGPNDLPACALLLSVQRTPREIGDGIEAIYRALYKQTSAWRGDPLQTAANLLYLTGLTPTEAAKRFDALYTALGKAGLHMGQTDYDEVAILCFVSLPVPKIVETLMDYRNRLREELARVDREMAFSLAANLTFQRLVVGHKWLGALADLKLLLDMQTIIEMRSGG